MIPPFDPSGNLPPGIHRASWRQFRARFGQTPHRRRLLRGLEGVIRLLRDAAGKTMYVDGSFVTSAEHPKDWDGCWDMEEVNLERLDPIFFTFERGRAVQKAESFGEFFPVQMPTGVTGKTFLEFFQTDKETGEPKGIVALDLRRWRP